MIRLNFSFNKKIFFIFIVLALISITSFFIWERYFRLTPVEEFSLAKFSPKENFKIIEKENQKLVVNLKDGISFAIPKDWEVRPKVLPKSVDFLVYSKDAEIGERAFLLKKGCKISTLVVYVNTNLENLKKYLSERKNPLASEEITEIFDVRGKYKAIRTNAKLEKFNMGGVAINIPLNRRVYEISLDFALPDKERCISIFNQVLNTLEIKRKLWF